MNIEDNAEHLVTVRQMFFGNGEAWGTPDAPKQEGFLALARAGRNVWNAWRVKWPELPADFNSIDFTKREPIDFSGFIFDRFGREIVHGQVAPGDVTFLRAKFGNQAKFTGAQFGESPNFYDAQFGSLADFDGAKFGTQAIFNGAHFGDLASFRNTVFGERTRFDGAQFGHRPDFESAYFGTLSSFIATQFGTNANFYGVAFEHGVRLDGAQFGDNVVFENARFGLNASFRAMTLAEILAEWGRYNSDKIALKTRTTRSKGIGAASNVFLSISFRDACFDGDVTFQDRTFLGPTSFDHTTFKGVPKLHGCKLHQDTSFDGADFKAPASPEAARAYRTLKLAMAQQQATREEQGFFRLEMQAENALATGPRRILFDVYENLSNYGFSLSRPLWFWLICLIGFSLAHGALADLSHGVRVGAGWLPKGVDWARTIDLGEYVLINAVPLPGFDKVQSELREVLFRPDTGGLGRIVILLDVIHKILALVALFLAGLALRNLFKMKG